PLDKHFYEQYVAAAGLVPVDLGRAFPPAEGGTLPHALLRQPARGGWDLGLTALRAPLGLSSLATGPSVALRLELAPFLYYGVRGTYALMPSTFEGIRLHRATVQGLVGTEGLYRTPLFLEAGAGWGVLGVTKGPVRMADPLVLTTHAAAGVTATVAGLRLRLAATLSGDLVTLDGKDRWDTSYGVELALRR
ncbi:caspase family protein, partial [Pyxidicoccus sp. 3LFB2]